MTHYTDVSFIENCNPDLIERNALEYRRLRDAYHWGAQDAKDAAKQVVWEGQARDLYRRRLAEATSLVAELAEPLGRASTALFGYASAVRTAQQHVKDGVHAGQALDRLMASIDVAPITRDAQTAEPMRRWEDLRATTGFFDWLAELGADVDSIRTQADALHQAASDAFETARASELNARTRCAAELRAAREALPDFDPRLTKPADEVLRGDTPLVEETGEATRNRASALPGDVGKPTTMPGSGADTDVSGGLKDLRGAAAHDVYIHGAPADGINPFLNTGPLDPDRTAWIQRNKYFIERAAAKYGIPADLLAGIAWAEIGGQGTLMDDGVGQIRSWADSPLSPVDSEHLPWRLGGEVDATSYGPLSIQTRRAAEVLGYDPEHLTDGQREQVVASLEDPTQNIYIAAAYLRSLKDESGAQFVPPDQMTDAQKAEVAARYNGGPYWQDPGAQSYGRAYTQNLPNVRGALEGS